MNENLLQFPVKLGHVISLDLLGDLYEGDGHIRLAVTNKANEAIPLSPNSLCFHLSLPQIDKKITLTFPDHITDDGKWLVTQKRNPQDPNSLNPNSLYIFATKDNISLGAEANIIIFYNFALNSMISSISTLIGVDITGYEWEDTIWLDVNSTYRITGLYAYFKGKRTISNDDSKNCLNLYLKNLSSEVINISGFGSISDSNPKSTSTLIASFDSANEGQDYAWALARHNVVEKITISSEGWNIERSQDIGLPYWMITHSSDLQLKPQEEIGFKIDAIQTTFDPGFTNLYLRYKNFPNGEIPNYFGGKLIVRLEKTPAQYGLINGSGYSLTDSLYQI